MKYLAVFCILCNLLNLFNCERSSKWHECGCRWATWTSWSKCSEECNGRTSRTRSVWSTDKPGCPDDFSTCATPGSGWDYSRCNTFCYHGGTSNGYSCSCATGFYGTCCGHQKNCGYPGSISNGRVHGTTYTYGATISYSCYSNYILVEGSHSRRCTQYEYWSGSRPRCAFFNSCGSGPCQHGGTCTNKPDAYLCKCRAGWTGKNCEVDITPPVMKNCPHNINMRTDNLTKRITWQEPKFTDQHGMFDVVVTSNYPTSSFIFPWGDFKVSYTAVKPSNGLTTECLFETKVRPNPCPVLEPPLNAAVVCNNWKTDFGQICMLFCKHFFTVAKGINPEDLYVCGASGSWFPKNTMPDCSVEFPRLPKPNGYKVANMYSNCSCEEDKREMRKHYINKLNYSDFKKACIKYEADCKEENVLVTC